jgi:hypothetical protein
MAKTSTERGTSTLELEEDRDFERRERVVRRTGTWALCAFLVAAAAGLFGSGPLSNVETRSSDSVILARFERFTRNRATTTLDLMLRSGTREVQVGVNATFAEKIKIEQITPQPTRVSTSGSRHVYEFESTGPDSVVRVVLRYRPETLGWLTAVITSAQSQLRFRQLVYP